MKELNEKLKYNAEQRAEALIEKSREALLEVCGDLSRVALVAKMLSSSRTASVKRMLVSLIKRELALDLLEIADNQTDLFDAPKD